MNKANIKFKTIFWFILVIIAIVVLILCSIIIKNSNYIIEANREFVILETAYVSSARVQISYSIGGIAFSTVIILMGSYISYAGFKSWSYNAIL
ncbi:hypothetical protein VBM87_01020 [Mycoplasma sp. 744]|uniref:hypothetical protein n=1 Tax=unclassified Mycoplasma TaxID=2683645 RepID=UPI00211C2507|nr:MULTISPECIES: hypothetical protein [unclassified Mycoplasma]MEA4115366.1 hypothetical protein [Mycoplasma sp. 744]UUM19370.1 hypothetical protein NPA14_00635 [Mycoplasma sp. 1018B]